MAGFGNPRVMGCSRDDLLRWLREMHGPGVTAFTDGRLDLATVGIPVVVAVADAPERRLGMVRFRELTVSFEYAEGRAADAGRWIAAFDRHTQRGGG